MNNIKSHHTLVDIHPDSKIWIYTISNKLSENQEQEIANALDLFCANWTAHSKELRAFWNIYDSRILVLGVDEHLNPASGCSIDKSVHFLQELEQHFQLEFFNRMLFSYVIENTIYTLHRDNFQLALDNKEITPDTMVINTLAKNWGEWINVGMQTLQNSWMKNLFQISVA